ncbi:uncharacterized protein LOC129810688 isoform X2 [Salvelinus fontinalis]|uniref:uncharacterized protein LOC129810688 isoform X2 n=1 Tax=Salvelinus fontinalis TaxID=8038 RepID=UPI0024853754|nr:uncharacterized protein LOC129810688 isoform X2 [Salvelinus fontinalis]
MGIWRKVNLLLFLIGTLVKPGLSTVILDQPPRTVEVHLGSSLTLNCSFMPQTRVRVNWYFSPTGLSSCSSNTLLNSSTHSADKTVKLDAGGHVSKESRKSWSRFILKDVTYNNSGWYFCKVSVEIPILQQACSNGTQVNISDNQMKSTTYTPLMTENPIYSNMPPPRSAIKQPSLQPGIQMDNQKIPSPLKHTRTPVTAHYSEHVRTPTPARAHDSKYSLKF